MDFESAYPRFAGRSRELFRSGQRGYPRRRRQQRPHREVRLEAVPAVHGRRAPARGSRDVDGHEYVDYLLGLGPMILGHRHPVVTRAVATRSPSTAPASGCRTSSRSRPLARWSTPCPASRWSGSPTRAARPSARPSGSPGPAPGAGSLVRFEGHYHGWQDTVYWSNHVDPAAAGPAAAPRPVASGPGVPPELADTLIVLTWNDPESFVAVMAERGDEVAAVITEPAVFNTGCILPEPGYLELLRSGDAQARRPADLRRGHHRLPVLPRRRPGVVRRHARPDDPGQGARRRLPRGRHRRHARGDVHDRRRAVTRTRAPTTPTWCSAPRSRPPWTCWPSRGSTSVSGRWATGWARACATLAAEAGVPVRVEGLGTVFQIWFSDHPIRNWRDAAAYAHEARFTRWWQEMLLRGVLFHPSQYENLFVSLVHTDADIDETLARAADALAAVAAGLGGA